VLATLTSQLTSGIAQHGAYAVFAIMALDSLLPLGSEVAMLYAGVVAGGAAGSHVTVVGAQVPFGAESFALLVVAGTLGTLAGALAGYAIGARGGHVLIDDRRRWPHVSPEAFERAREWLERHGRAALFLGRLTPVVRSFISIPAGVLRLGLGVYSVWTLLGSLVWCSAFAAAGWAVAASWQNVHHGFRYVDYAAVALTVTLLAAAMIHRRSAARRTRTR
jgi:membrane protein DedA with SNARE-associated domain